MQKQIKINVTKEVVIDLPFSISDEAARKIKEILEAEQRQKLPDDVLNKMIDYLIKDMPYSEYSSKEKKEKNYSYPHSLSCACGKKITFGCCKYCGTYAKYH